MRQRATVAGGESLPAPAATPPISAIIADDEPLARNELAYLLGQIGDIEVIGTAKNGLEAVDLIEKLDPAVAFLDIQMPGLDGLGVVRRLRERGVELPQIVFSTAYDQFAVEAFRLEATDYILKPVERARLEETVARARRAVTERIAAEEGGTATDSGETAAATVPRPANPKLVVRIGARNLVVGPHEVIYATIEDGVITMSTDHGEGQASFRTLEDLQTMLDPDIFWRVHRSWVVNINRVREVAPWFKSTYQLKMDDRKATEIPVSRTHSRRLRELLNL